MKPMGGRLAIVAPDSAASHVRLGEFCPAWQKYLTRIDRYGGVQRGQSSPRPSRFAGDVT
jgi:hypothetical protein